MHQNHLEKQLYPALHAISLLDDEIAREEVPVELDMADLEVLQRDSRTEVSLQKQQLSKVCSHWLSHVGSSR